MGRNNNRIVDQSFDGFTIKVIALVSMFLDHFAAIVIERYLQNQGIAGGILHFWKVDEAYRAVAILGFLMRAIGRMAFPIFCFFLVEGFFLTSHRRRYALRLFVFALISELPFDLAFQKRLVDFHYQNVYFTLLLALLAMWAVEVLQVKLKVEKGQLAHTLVLIGCALVACGIAEGTHIDYGAMGIMTIFVMYSKRGDIAQKLEMLLGCIILAISNFLEAFAFLDIFLIARYNGKRGRNMKYFFYAFYPLHIFLLWGLCVLLKI